MRRRPFLRAALSACAAVAFALPLAAQAQERAASDADGARPAGGEDVLAIVGGDVHVGNGVVFRRGVVLCRGGKIAAVGSDVEVPEGARVVDAAGRRVLPGFVAPAGSNFGIQRGRPQPGERFGDCLDPESLYNELALASGITSYYASGPRRGLVGDQTAVIKPALGAPELMVLKEPAALEVGWSDAAPSDRAGFRDQLRAARTFLAGGAKGRPPVPPTWLAALRREIPVRIRAVRRSDVLAAVALAQEFDLRLVLEDAHEAWTVAQEVAASGAVPIVAPRVRIWPNAGEEERSGSTIECAALLEKAGARFCILPPGGFGGPGSGISLQGIAGRDLMTYSVEGAFAIRGGASQDAVLRAITLTAAEALGVADRVGSLERGKDADVVVYQGDPFDYRLLPEVTIVSGRVLYERTKSKLFGHLPAR